ncbi:hypothetical protein FDP41_009177 [Naegleria fowleri]|uniref:Uncharacterized protein n=1 Tax=Naegleria fowleri TaxID=5763 RepID=A0A6A5BCF0_NAEFO|nr:uncharacterized protein FDP41_009177 [Naegleria fowleri]KAF0972572.1 hypothetical protein FDP41_009177 [Naegleria fowleri]
MKRVLPSRLQQLCHSSGSTWSSLSNRQVIGEAASDKNEKNASTTAFEKDQQEFLKNNPSVASVSSYDKSPSAVRKEKEKESSFFDNPNPIPNLNTTEKMANKNPIGSYTPGSYVVGSTTVEEDDSDIPSHHMGKPLDGDPNLFFWI